MASSHGWLGNRWENGAGLPPWQASFRFARLPYGQARALLDEYTAIRGPGTGWDLHEYRHSSPTHLGEAGAGLLMLMAKSRHKKPENVRRCLKPSPEAIARLTSLLARRQQAGERGSVSVLCCSCLP
ncbi:hypothetical protein ACFWNT_27785 [Streptomyces sp. NPDC058409]|uniref:hypothetical protein n=1 Tax=Streptomyces sp. NPDC058409 TaxID=3346484 RepID=UPI003668E82D